MSEHRSHKVKLSNLADSRSLCIISTKTPGPIIVSWALSVLVLMTEYKYMAIPFLFVSLILTFRKGTMQFRGCEKYFVLYNPETPNDGELFYLSEVAYWEYRVKKDGRDYVSLGLHDGEKVRITEGAGLYMYRYFQRVLPELERRNKKTKPQPQENGS